MKRLTTKEAMNLRRIETADEIPSNAVYYTNTCSDWGRTGERYSRLLDANFNEIENVRVRYTDALNNLIHVSDENDDHDYKTAKLVYVLKEKNDKGFWMVKRIDY